MKMYHNLRITGKVVYAVVKNDAGQAWKPATSTFVTYTTTRSDFVVTLNEIGSTGFYGPTVIPGTGPGRTWEIYVREGGSADHNADEFVAEGMESIDANVVQLNGNTSNSVNLASVYGIALGMLDAVALIYDDTQNLINRIGTFTGTGVNTVLGFFKALFRTDATVPSDIGGTFDSATDSVQAQTDGSITLGLLSLNALKQYINTDTTLSTAVAGSVAKIAQGAATASVLLGEVITGSYPAGSWGERLQRIPNAAPGGAGGLPTVNASNYIAGLQSAVNITSTGGTITVGTGGSAGKVVNSDKSLYGLDAISINAIVSSIVADTWGLDVTSKLQNIFNATGDTYFAGISIIKDASVDEYTVQWYKNGVPVTSGITSPTIQVIKRSDGSDYVASTAMTQIASTGAYKYDASGGGRMSTGDSALVIVSATIDGSSRTWRKVVGKDIPS